MLAIELWWNVLAVNQFLYRVWWNSEKTYSLNIVKYSETCSNLQSWLLHSENMQKLSTLSPTCTSYTHQPPRHERQDGHSEDIDWIVSYPIRFERDYVKLLHPIRDLRDVNRALHYIWRNRKHIQCFYRVFCNSPSHSRILIGSIRFIRGQTHDWRHHYKGFPSAFQNGGTLWDLR